MVTLPYREKVGEDVKTIKSKMPKDPLERSIYIREGGIKRMQQNIVRIRREAEEEIAEVQKRIKEKQVLLDALKRGQLT